MSEIIKTPKCFDSGKQYMLWLRPALAAARVTHVRYFTICEDCTPEYKAKMLLAGRCENPWYAGGPGTDDPAPAS